MQHEYDYDVDDYIINMKIESTKPLLTSFPAGHNARK
jgi:hypothetical protein